MENPELNQQDNELQAPSELDVLKQRATLLGISFSNNIGVETLRKKVAEKMAELEAPASTSEASSANPLEGQTEAPVVKKSLRQHLIEKHMKLVRLRITNLDPKKKDLPGEILTVANEHLGTVRKFVPFGEATDEGYHVPYCIYRMLESRKFLQIRTFKDRRNGNQIRVESNWVREFALEVLPPLDQDGLDRLAAQQAAAGGVNG